jgi:hypothetical protein
MKQHGYDNTIKAIPMPKADRHHIILRWREIKMNSSAILIKYAKKDRFSLLPVFLISIILVLCQVICI